MYQALYRKWRPRTFDEVVGQPHVTQTLKKQLVSDRLSHAYLFIGTRGTGKTSCAKILSKAVNCENPENGNPCNKCPSCIGIDNGSVLDVEELDAASNNGVDNVRALRDEAVFTPATVKKRVYIIDEVHMLSTSAFNALLKILEEPPSHLMFILATTESHKIPATILSRCQRYSFRRVSAGDIAGRIKTVTAAEGLEITDDAADMLARLADGSMRDALSLLDQCTYNSPIDSKLVLSVAGLVGGVKTAELFGHICQGDVGSALSILDEIYFGGKDVGALLGELGTLVRDLLMMMIAPDKGASLLSGAYDGETLKNLSGSASADNLMIYLNIINAALTDITKSANRKLTAEMCVITLCAPNRVYSTPSTAPIYSSVPTQDASEITAYKIPENSPLVSTAPSVPPNVMAADIPGTSAPVTSNPEASTPEPEESPSSTPDNSASTDIWPDVLNILKDKIDLAVYSVLSDSSQVTCRYSEGVINMSFGNDFTKGIVTTKDIMAEIKKSAESVSGGTVMVKILSNDQRSAPTHSKLDKLSKFDNITFK